MTIFIAGCQLASLTSQAASFMYYRIRSITRRGYYLFHRAILHGYYSRAAFIINPSHAWYVWSGRSAPLRGYRQRRRRSRREWTSFGRPLVHERRLFFALATVRRCTRGCSRAHTYHSNTSRGYYSRAATNFRASGGAASIREQRQIESSVWSSKYGNSHGLVKDVALDVFL